MIETDVLIVGAGPAGLAAAIALKRGAKANGDVASPRVIVLDKGRSVGSHVLSGAIIDPSGFVGLLTDDEIDRLPTEAHVVKESFRTLLSRGASVKIPWVPPMMSSKGYPVASLTKMTQYLAQIAVNPSRKVVPVSGLTIGMATGRITATEMLISTT